MNRIVIAYDVSHNKARRQISKLLDQYGVRVQKSVYSFHLSKSQSIELISKLKDLFFRLQSARYHTKSQCLNIMIIPSCKNCFESSITLGETSEDSPYFLIV